LFFLRCYRNPDFGTFANSDRMSVDQIMTYWEGGAAKKKAGYAAREVVLQAMLGEARRPAVRTAPRDFVLEGLVHEPRAKGCDAHDLADFAAGRLIEEEARLLANCPPEIHEEMLRECGWAMPFEA
jgi:hypothetical protein